LLTPGDSIKAGKRYEKLQCFLPGGQEKRAYADMAREVGVSEGALGAEFHRPVFHIQGL
jgi:hypothetical protein